MRRSAVSSSSTSRSDQSTSSASSRAHSSIRAANTAEDSHNSRAIPAHCGPWPGNIHTTPGAAPATPSTTFDAGSPAANAVSPDSSSARSAATTTPRCSSTERVVVTVAYPTSAGRSPASDATRSSSRPAWARSAPSVLPDTSTGTGRGPPAPEPPPPGAVSGASGPGGASPCSAGSSAGESAGASATTTWQLVPPRPKELTPASRGPSGHGPVAVLTRIPSRSSGMAGGGPEWFRLAGSFRWPRDSATLIRPTTPAAPSRCPMLVFTDPDRQGRSVPRRPPGRPVPAEHRAERRRLDRVARLRPGAVQLDIPHLARVHPGPVAGVAQQCALRIAVGDGETRAAAVVVHRAAEQYAVHPVAVGHRVRQPLQHDDTAALTADSAVRPGVEGVAAAVRRERAGAGEGERARGREVEMDAAGQRQPGRARQQALARQVHGDQRRGLRRVHREARSAQAQLVGDPVGDHPPAESRQRVVGETAPSPLPCTSAA